MILDELEELRCFLEQRLSETEAAAEGTGAGATFSVLSDSSGLDSSRLRDLSVRTSALVGRLNAGQIHHLQLIRSSPKYVDRLVDSLRQKLNLEQRMRRANDELAERKDRAIQEQVG